MPSLRPNLLLAVILALAAAAYLPGLLGDFLLDDYANLVENRALQMADGSWTHWLNLVMSSDSGVLRRPVSMFSFGLNVFLSGMNPAAFKATNLLIHLLCGGLIYQLALQLIPRLRAHSHADPEPTTGLALFTTALWLLHPLMVSDVLYVVQRMNQLSTLFVLSGLICYCALRQRQIQTGKIMLPAAGFVMSGILAVLSKENGALLALYVAVVELLVFRFSAADPRTSMRLRRLCIIGMAVPTIALLFYTAINPAWLLDNYSYREYTLLERLLTECRVIWSYLLWILVPNPEWMGFYHDDIGLSRDLLNPPVTLLAVLAVAALPALALYLRNRAPALSFGLLWFLAGHALESTVLPLELAFEHRNYLPMAGLLMGLVTQAQMCMRQRQPVTLIMFGVAAVVTLASITAREARIWSSPLSFAQRAAVRHPNSSRAQYEYGRQIIQAEKREDRALLAIARHDARAYFERAMQLDAASLHPASANIISYIDEPAVPDSVIAMLEARQRRSRLFFQAPLTSIMVATARGSLHVTPEQMQRLVASALDNPQVPSIMRATLLTTYGRYLFEVAHDHQNAIGLTLAAVAQEPYNPLFELNAAELAVALGIKEQAVAHLARVKLLDRFGIYTKDVQKLEGRLSAVPPPLAAVSN